MMIKISSVFVLAGLAQAYTPSKKKHIIPQKLQAGLVEDRIASPLRDVVADTKNLVTATPLVRLDKLNELYGNPLCQVYGKCEFMNPTGSQKDRIAKHILESAQARGELKRGDTVVVASSGNTAVATAMWCGRNGYNCIVITNTKTSQEKVKAISDMGAEVLLTENGVPVGHPRHYQMMEDTLCAQNPTYFSVNQYDNPCNPEAYYISLGPEIWQQTNEEVDFLVAAGSTGGTLSGTARFLKEQNPEVQAIMPDPQGSIFYDYWKTGEILSQSQRSHVEGIGKDSIPGAMDFRFVDAMPRFTDAEAFEMCHKIAKTEGLVVGGSAGANVWAALEMAKQQTEPKCIVAILCDSGTKYLSKYWNEDWLESNCADFNMEHFYTHHLNI